MTGGRETRVPRGTAAAHTVVDGWLRSLLPHVPPTPTEHRCPVLDWAASGGMALTGHADGPPLLSPASAYALAGDVLRALTWVTGRIGTPVDMDPATALFGRAGLAGLRRAGRHSAGGATRLLRTADGWGAITLGRPDDFACVPAILGVGEVAEPWSALESAAVRWPTARLVERARLLGVPAAALPVGPTAPDWSAAPAAPWRLTRVAPPVSELSMTGLTVVDLSAMWAGPLCGRLLGAAGARVVKVESTYRPDGVRAGDPRFFDWLHRGQEFRAIDFQSDTGRKELGDLLNTAEVVIEASRPRALAQLGLAPELRVFRPGQVWLSITGYGRADPLPVAFGDDAAVAGGLVGWNSTEPVFCGDAIADPLTGICGALAVAAAAHGGGGVLIDLPMRAVAAAFAMAPVVSHGSHRVLGDGGEWVVECTRQGHGQAVLPPTALPVMAC